MCIQILTVEPSDIKLLGLSRSLGSTGLYGKGILELHISSLTEEYIFGKV